MPTSKTWPGGGTGATPATYEIPLTGELNWADLADFLNSLADAAQSTTFQKFAVREAVTSPVTVSAATDCVVVSDLTVPGAVTVNLPAGVNKQVFVIVDGKGDAGTNNVTINRNGSDTIAGSTTFVLSQNRQSVILIYNAADTDWKIAANAAAGFSDPLTTRGDVIYRNAANVTARLPVGAANTVLASDGTDPSYRTIVNADVNAAAAIAGSKISPAFGTQNVSNSGTNIVTATATGVDAVRLNNVATSNRVAAFHIDSSGFGRVRLGNGNGDLKADFRALSNQGSYNEATGTSTSIAGGGSATWPISGTANAMGFFMVAQVTGSGAVAYGIFGGGYSNGVTNLATTAAGGNTWTVTATPSATQFGIVFDNSTNTFTVYNGTGSASSFNLMCFGGGNT